MYTKPVLSPYLSCLFAKNLLGKEKFKLLPPLVVNVESLTAMPAEKRRILQIVFDRRHRNTCMLFASFKSLCAIGTVFKELFELVWSDSFPRSNSLVAPTFICRFFSATVLRYFLPTISRFPRPTNCPWVSEDECLLTVTFFFVSESIESV